jgi:hypothetical protein
MDALLGGADDASASGDDHRADSSDEIFTDTSSSSSYYSLSNQGRGGSLLVKASTDGAVDGGGGNGSPLAADGIHAQLLFGGAGNDDGVGDVTRQAVLLADGENPRDWDGAPQQPCCSPQWFLSNVMLTFPDPECVPCVVARTSPQQKPTKERMKDFLRGSLPPPTTQPTAVPPPTTTTHHQQQTTTTTTPNKQQRR